MKFEKINHYLNVSDFYSCVKSKIALADERNYAIVSLDLDNFNFINDLFGYEIGDIVLYKMANMFSSSLNDEEYFSKINADNFKFLVKFSDEQSIISRFENMLKLKEYMQDLLPTHYSLVAAGGIIRLTDKNDSMPSVFDKSNYARKKAKGNNVSTFIFFDEKMSEELEWKKIITLAMEEALQNKEFEMYLQPKICLKNREIIGAEALVRWNNKTYGVIFPDQFIPILEQNGFIEQLDFFMLEEACHLIKRMTESAEDQPFPISVNFSKLHIHSEDFVEKVYNIVHTIGVPANMIEIEMTESIFSDDFKALCDISNNFKQRGFLVALDDFGSAYSSLNYLKDVPFDIIKIDKGFLDSSVNTEKGKLIITKIVGLINALHLSSVMEGVETKEQMEFLKAAGCEIGQGYFFAKPMPVEKYIDFCKEYTSKLL